MHAAPRSNLPPKSAEPSTAAGHEQLPDPRRGRILIAIHERIDGPDGKRFVWRQPDGTPGLNGTPLASMPLYGIHLLDGRPTVVITEGEKCADALIMAGVPAVASTTGAAATPGRAALADLTGRDVVLWPMPTT